MNLEEQEEGIKLDKLDYAIIKHLQLDGRKSFTEISDDLNVAVSTIRNRYNRLIEDKVLRIIGRPDPEKMGLHAYSRVMISVKPAQKLNDVLSVLSKLKEVSFLAVTSGTFNIELNLMCTNNNHLLEIIDQINNIDGVEAAQTTMYLNVLKWGQ